MKRILAALAIVLCLPLLAGAQAKGAQGQKLVLEFVDGADLSVVTADKSLFRLGSGIVEGDFVPVGATITTGPSTTAELKLTPNGTIIRLAKSTTFTVSGLASTPQEKNAFALAAGKIRAVAAKGGQYEMRSQTAVCGVRGTDFAFAVEPGAKALLMVSKGLVAFQKLDDSGSLLGEIPVAAGEAADAFGAAFASFKFSSEQFAEAYGDLAFQKLKELDVPSGEPVAEAPEEAEGEEPSAGSAAAKEEGPFVKWLREALGMEIGSVTINESTYAKAVIQPEIKLGKVKLGLYLPIIYSSNLFDPEDWYKPNGNSEWDFGTGIGWKADPLAAGADALSDLALKIKYFEYGRQLEDPFFVKVGNLKGLTLGHGLIMRNYANDTEFPSVRRVGFNLGIDGGSAGFEAIVNDLAEPEIFGTRLFFRPVPDFKLALGFSAVADLNPVSSLDAALVASLGDPIMFGTGLDLDLPIVQGDLMSLRFFADVATTIPYLRDATTLGGDSGFRYDILYEGGKFRNWGAASGLMGRVLFLDWRLEYRYFTGLFRSSYFDSTYDRKRAEYALAYQPYLDGASISGAPTVMGVYGEGGFSLLRDKLSFGFGYFWPWSPESSTLAEQVAQSNDELHARLAVKKGLVPVVDLSGAIFYDRRGLARAIADGSFRLFDESTVFGGELVMPVPKTPNLDLAILFATVPVRDSTGTITWKNEAAGIPEVKPSISIETRLHF